MCGGAGRFIEVQEQVQIKNHYKKNYSNKKIFKNKRVQLKHDVFCLVSSIRALFDTHTHLQGET